VSADPTQIHQILMNLCTNAQYAMGNKKGALDISLSPMELDVFNAAYVSIPPGS